MRRIVLMQQSPSREDALLRAVVDAASRLNAEIAGLFIEDADLLKLAGMPFACEVCFPSATRREMDVGYLEKSLRRLASEARHTLESIASRTELPVSFRVARGSVLAELLAAASDTDIVIAGSLARAHAKPGLTVVCRPGISPQRIAELLSDLGPRVAGNITVALLDDDGPSCRRWEEELRRAIASHALARRLRVLCPSGQVEFERLLRE